MGLTAANKTTYTARGLGYTQSAMGKHKKRYVLKQLYASRTHNTTTTKKLENSSTNQNTRKKKKKQLQNASSHPDQTRNTKNETESYADDIYIYFVPGVKYQV